MKTESESYLPFSQRTGLAPVPPQLELGEVSPELRRLLDYFVSLEIRRESVSGWDHRYFQSKWERVAMDFHVRFLGQPVGRFENDATMLGAQIGRAIRELDIGRLFDLIEFLIRHPGCSGELKRELASAFVDARAAYRVLDGAVIVAIGTHEQAHAYERALADAGEGGAGAARTHLVAAGVALRSANWAGSVRESIHAVEAAAVRLAPGSDTLGTALHVLERHGHLHGGLKRAFAALYGYASDEEGVRHALALREAPQVDEADALFMLGACASFVSYLLARGAQQPQTAVP